MLCTGAPPEAAVAASVTVTLLRFQPAAFGEGVSAAVVVGGLATDWESILTANPSIGTVGPPLKMGWKAPDVMGKFAEVVEPVTYVLPVSSTAIALAAS
jgi:hypothetical protein